MKNRFELVSEYLDLILSFQCSVPKSRASARCVAVADPFAASDSFSSFLPLSSAPFSAVCLIVLGICGHFTAALECI